MKIIEKEELYLCGFLVEPTENFWGKYEHETSLHEQPELVDWSGYEVRFFPSNRERIFTACRQKEKVTSPHYELLTIPSLTWAVFDIDFKIEQDSQYTAIHKWLDNNKNNYKRIKWGADGRVDESEFIVCHFDHDGIFGKDKIMKMWIPIERVKR